MKKLIFYLFCLILSINTYSQATLPHIRTTWGSEPVGWTNNGCTQRSTVFACTGNDGTIFDASTDYRIVQFNSSPNQLSFKLKKSSMSGESKLVVSESIDGTLWSSIGTYGTATGATTITDCNDITINLTSTTRYIKWAYTKAIGNCDMDDVNISAGTSGSSTITDLFISEYVEGGLSDKYLELFNNTGITLDLSNYSISLYRNGTDGTETNVQLNTIQSNMLDNTTLVISNSASTGTLSCTPSISGSAGSGICSFSGNDPIALKKNSIIIDYLGTGTVTASDWGKLQTFRRNLSSSVPSATYNSSQWDKMVYNFSDLCSYTYTPLPIELIDFNYKLSNNFIILYWKTATETNNAYFELLKSTDGINYNLISLIQGAGTVNYPNNYEYHDELPIITTYYKLKQVDFDGKYTIYGPKQVNIISPQQQNIKNVQYFDMLGREINNPLEGLYIVKINNLYTKIVYFK